MGLPIAATLLASGAAALPACCRRDGKHRCMRRADLRIERGPAPSISGTEAKCLQFPQTMGVMIHGPIGLSVSAAVFAEIISHPAVAPQTLSNYCVSLVRWHQKRGPPTSALS